MYQGGATNQLHGSKTIGASASLKNGRKASSNSSEDGGGQEKNNYSRREVHIELVKKSEWAPFKRKKSESGLRAERGGRLV